MPAKCDIRSIVQRLHPMLYLAAGGWGALLNWLCTLWLYQTYSWPIHYAFFCGLCLNCLFNFWYTKTVLKERANNNHKSSASYYSFFLVNLLLITLGIILIWLQTAVLDISVHLALILTIGQLSLLSLFMGRIWVFVSPFSAEVAYGDLEAEFYENSSSQAQVGAFRAWYHEGRFTETRELVESLFQDGMRVCDLACGGSEWNKNGLPITGIDVNEKMLSYGQQRGQLNGYHIGTTENTGLPDESTDMIIFTEVLEHLVHPKKALKEIHRILKPGGYLIVSVPWDHPFSPFFWLFNANCFYRGYILGEEYYYQRCGHVGHFTKRRLKKLLRQNGFSIKETYVFRSLLIYGICYKEKEAN